MGYIYKPFGNVQIGHDFFMTFVMILGRGGIFGGVLRACPWLRVYVYPLFCPFPNVIMNIGIKFSQSAFKHDISELDIRMAFDNVLYDERLDESDGEDELDAKYLLIGFGRNAGLLEILYNIIDEDTLKVFRAMKCRNIYLPLIKHWGNDECLI